MFGTAPPLATFPVVVECVQSAPVVLYVAPGQMQVVEKTAKMPQLYTVGENRRDPKPF